MYNSVIGTGAKIDHCQGYTKNHIVNPMDVIYQAWMNFDVIEDVCIGRFPMHTRPSKTKLNVFSSSSKKKKHWNKPCDPLLEQLQKNIIIWNVPIVMWNVNSIIENNINSVHIVEYEICKIKKKHV